MGQVGAAWLPLSADPTGHVPERRPMVALLVGANLDLIVALGSQPPPVVGFAGLAPIHDGDSSTQAVLLLQPLRAQVCGKRHLVAGEKHKGQGKSPLGEKVQALVVPDQGVTGQTIERVRHLAHATVDSSR